MLGHIRGVSLIILDSMAKILGVVELLLAMLQVQEHFLDLEEEIVLYIFEGRGEGGVFGGSDGVAEVGDHKELLHEAVHIADAA